ncbi:MAG: hypothetical protein EOO46_15185 [Flavobacterium sp.]|nr:MAG: hypothetical protein EOO46_15185 [Flavobacterium sp.]
MRPETEELYKKNCRFEKNCKPEPRIRKYESGITHYVTQCTTCGATFGQPFSKKLIVDHESIKPFDEEFEKQFVAEAYKDLFELSDKQKKLQEIRKRLKSDYFKNVLKLPFDNFETAYNAYLNSPFWQTKRKLILERDNFLCQFCNAAKATQVHHLSYDNLGNECDFELLSVCYPCHQIIHDIETNENIYDRSQRKEL